ncbi:Rho-type GTPase activating protein Rga1, variant 3 [Balamuthia mandrillaris]
MCLPSFASARNTLISMVARASSRRFPSLPNLFPKRKANPPLSFLRVVLSLPALLDSYKEEGFFRISGTHTRIVELKERFDRGETPDLNQEKDPHVVAGLFKLYFRSLPEPLLTFELYDMFLAAACTPFSLLSFLLSFSCYSLFIHLFSNGQTAIPDKKVSLEKVKAVMEMLPPINYKCTKVLTRILVRVNNQSHLNKMTANNLAIVFAPSILKSPTTVQLPSPPASSSSATGSSSASSASFGGAGKGILGKFATGISANITAATNTLNITSSASSQPTATMGGAEDVQRLMAMSASLQDSPIALKLMEMFITNFSFFFEDGGSEEDDFIVSRLAQVASPILSSRSTHSRTPISSPSASSSSTSAYSSTSSSSASSNGHSNNYHHPQASMLPRRPMTPPPPSTTSTTNNSTMFQQQDIVCAAYNVGCITHGRRQQRPLADSPLTAPPSAVPSSTNAASAFPVARPAFPLAVTATGGVGSSRSAFIPRPQRAAAGSKPATQTFTIMHHTGLFQEDASTLAWTHKNKPPLPDSKTRKKLGTATEETSLSLLLLRRFCRVAFRSADTDKYIQVEGQEVACKYQYNNPINCWLTKRELFIPEWDGQHLSLRSAAELACYVMVGNDGFLKADILSIQALGDTAHLFEVEVQSQGGIALKSVKQGKYVGMDNEGKLFLVTNEAYKRVFKVNLKVAVRSSTNGKYIATTTVIGNTLAYGRWMNLQSMSLVEVFDEGFMVTISSKSMQGKRRWQFEEDALRISGQKVATEEDSENEIFKLEIIGEGRSIAAQLSARLLSSDGSSIVTSDKTRPSVVPSTSHEAITGEASTFVLVPFGLE